MCCTGTTIRGKYGFEGNTADEEVRQLGRNETERRTVGIHDGMGRNTEDVRDAKGSEQCRICTTPH